MPDLVQELSRCPLFERLDQPSLARLATVCRPMKRRANEIIIREGDPVEGFFIVLEGLVRVFKIAPDGRERTLHTVRPPHAFAEAALFHPGGYPAFAAAVENSRVLLVPREPFVRMLREQPESAVCVFESLSQWMHRLLDQLENETFLSARAKLASYILHEVRRQPRQGSPCRIKLTLPKKQIASQLGMAPETFSRAQADLEAGGLIRVSGRSIEVDDLPGLDAVILGGAGN